MTYELLEQHYSFGGTQSVYMHRAETTNSDMRFGLYLPPQKNASKVPVLYWLSA